MKVLAVVLALIAFVNADGFGGHGFGGHGYGGHGYGGHGYGGHHYHHAPKAIIAPVVHKVPFVSYINKIVPAGVSHHAFTVPESRFSEQRWETPGRLFA